VVAKAKRNTNKESREAFMASKEKVVKGVANSAGDLNSAVTLTFSKRLRSPYGQRVNTVDSGW